MVCRVKVFNLILALPFLLALGVAAHVFGARAVKAVLWAWSPLATGEPEAYRYERLVYPTADPKMTQIVAVAAAAGLLFWGGLVRGSVWLWLGGLLVVVAAVVLDLLRWQRVASSANYLWFQRGFGSTVHQVAIENIRDLAVEETAARGFTLRHGTHNQLVRLRVRMADKRVVALPKTDAHSGLDDVEAVANHLRQRLQRLGDRRALDRASSDASVAARAAAQEGPQKDAELREALRRLRKNSLAPKVPRAVKSDSSS
jgi:hypothetical protein